MPRAREERVIEESTKKLLQGRCHQSEELCPRVSAQRAAVPFSQVACANLCPSVPAEATLCADVMLGDGCPFRQKKGSKRRISPLFKSLHPPSSVLAACLLPPSLHHHHWPPAFHSLHTAEAPALAAARKGERLWNRRSTSAAPASKPPSSAGHSASISVAAFIAAETQLELLSRICRLQLHFPFIASRHVPPLPVPPKRIVVDSPHDPSVNHGVRVGWELRDVSVEKVRRGGLTGCLAQTCTNWMLIVLASQAFRRGCSECNTSPV